MSVLPFLIFSLVATSAEGSRVVGVFDNQTYSETFSRVMATHFPNLTHQVVHLEGMSPPQVTRRLCSMEDSLFIYAVLTSASSLHIHTLSAIASVLNIPVFLYDTTLNAVPANYKMRMEGDMLYYMNSEAWDEGRAVADMSLTFDIPHVTILVQEEYQYDGFLAAVKQQFTNSKAEESNEVIFSKDESVISLLTQLQSLIISRADRHYISTEVVIIHCDPNVSYELIKGAEVLFHDKQIIWLLSLTAIGDGSDLLQLDSDISTLEVVPVDEHFIKDTLSLANNKMNSIKADIEHHRLLEDKDCEKYDATSRNKNLLWRKLLDDSELTINRKLNYYRYVMKMKKHLVHQWAAIGHVDSSNSHPIPGLRTFLFNGIVKEMYTVVTILEPPFTHEATFSLLDGEDYCPTPSKLCFRISEATIAADNHSSETVREIFQEYYMKTDPPSRLYEKTCCEGLCIDLLKTLSEELQFDFQLYIVPDGEYGAYDREKNGWSGLVRELLDDRADMVMASFSINSMRSVVIDYSNPFYYSGFSLMAINKKDPSPKWFSYLEPYPLSAWAMIIVMACGVFFFLGFSEWYSPRGFNTSRRIDQSAYTLSSAIKTTFSLMSGNTIPTKSPVSWTAKWGQNVWGFFSIIYLSAYTANLTSSITDGVSLHSFENIYDPKLMTLEVAAPTNGAIEQYIKLVRPELFERMRRHKVKTVSEAVGLLRANKLDVWMHDTPAVDYTVARNNSDCAVKKVLTFSVDSYGIGFPQDSMLEFKRSVNAKVLEYYDSGYLKRLHDIYFSSVAECQESLFTADKVELKLSNAAGLFLTLLGFVMVCFLLVGVEHLIYSFLIPYGKRQPPGSVWRSKWVMFFSQRIYRAIEKDGKRGKVVIKEFLMQIYQLKDFLTLAQLVKKKNTARDILRLSFQRGPQTEMKFYDVVAKIYELEKKKPLSTIFHMKEKKKKKEMVDIKNGLRGIVALTMGAPFTGSPSLMRIGERFAQGTQASTAKNTKSRAENGTELYPIMRLQRDDSASLCNSLSSHHTTTTSISEALDTPGEYSTEPVQSTTETIFV